MGNSVRNVTTIAGRELRSYFGQPIGWVLLGFFALLFSAFFYANLAYAAEQGTQQMGGQNVTGDMVRNVLQNASVLVLFMLPIVTMRTFSEEKHSGTFELLLTSPVTDFEILFGKFVGAVGVYLAMLAVTLVHIGIVYVVGAPEWKPILSGYLGLALLGASFIAMGLFISSTTKNQVVAAAVTFALLLLFWIINWFARSVGPTLEAVLNYLSVTQHFDDFGKGVIDSKHVIFYLSFIVFSLYLTLKSLDTERWRS
jgi:ABC-2 type transport system permease protein